MSSLFGAMSIALRSMLIQQSAISVTANNVSNINTEGYSRQRADLVEADAVFDGNHMVGTGVKLDDIVSLRDRVLELRLQQEKQQQGSLGAQVGALQDVETLFSADAANIGDSINSFFNSLSELSTNAASIPLRQSVMMSGNNLSSIFRNSASTLQQRQFSLDLDIQQSVQQINEMTAQIAELNKKIATSAHGSEMGTFEDQRNILLQRLSEQIDNNVIIADDGLAVTTKDGTALVLGGGAVPLSVGKRSNGATRIFSGTEDITDSIRNGKLAGFLRVREQVIPGILSDLDTLAGNIASAVNNIQHQGIDLNGNPGGDFFAAPPPGNVGAAAAFQLNLHSPQELAASLDGTLGDNANVNAILALRTQNFVQGSSPADFYSKLTFNLGSELLNAKSELNASELVMGQLADQRGAISAVSLDEEAANLIRYQRAFEAAARVLSVLSDLTDISVHLGSN